jgi:hypothetical protein
MMAKIVMVKLVTTIFSTNTDTHEANIEQCIKNQATYKGPGLDNKFFTYEAKSVTSSIENTPDGLIYLSTIFFEKIIQNK